MRGKNYGMFFSKMGKFGVFQLFSVFRDFVHKKTSFKGRKGDTRNQRETANQNMNKKVENKTHLNFALRAS
jgi:hypothetical protein